MCGRSMGIVYIGCQRAGNSNKHRYAYPQPVLTWCPVADGRGSACQAIPTSFIAHKYGDCPVCLELGLPPLTPEQLQLQEEERRRGQGEKIPWPSSTVSFGP